MKKAGARPVSAHAHEPIAHPPDKPITVFSLARRGGGRGEGMLWAKYGVLQYDHGDDIFTRTHSPEIWPRGDNKHVKQKTSPRGEKQGGWYKILRASQYIPTLKGSGCNGLRYTTTYHVQPQSFQGNFHGTYVRTP